MTLRDAQIRAQKVQFTGQQVENPKQEQMDEALAEMQRGNRLVSGAMEKIGYKKQSV